MGPNIRVNAVAPGAITGRWLETGLGPAYNTVMANIKASSPLQRICEPEDVADAIVALITGSDLVTGQILTVDGGMTLST